MKMVKSLILGSAAALVAMSGAQAADLPVKAKAVEYVRICSLYGAGFYYIPGTDTCIKLGGYLRVETAFNTNAVFNGAYATQGGAQNRLTNYYTARSREDFNIDTRTATEYGVLRTYFDATFSWTSGAYAGIGQGGTVYSGSAAVLNAAVPSLAGGIANPNDGGTSGGSLGVYHAFIQFAGFTMGKTISQFDAPWVNYPGNNFDGLVGGSGMVTGVNQLTYTWQFGNGVSLALSAQDQTAYSQAALLNLSAGAVANATFAGGTFGTSDLGGSRVPDLIASLKADQAWGMIQLSAVAHNIHAAYYGATEITGHPTDKWGFAVQGALTIKNIPTGVGDTINVQAVYTDGASRYNFQNLAPQNFAMYSGSNVAYQSVGVGVVADGIFANGTGISTVQSWGMRGAFNHNFDPYWSGAIYGAYAQLKYGNGGNALLCGAAPLSPSLPTVALVFSAIRTAVEATLAASQAFLAISRMLAPISSTPAATVWMFRLTSSEAVETTRAWDEVESALPDNWWLTEESLTEAPESVIAVEPMHWKFSRRSAIRSRRLSPILPMASSPETITSRVRSPRAAEATTSRISATRTSSSSAFRAERTRSRAEETRRPTIRRVSRRSGPGSRVSRAKKSMVPANRPPRMIGKQTPDRTPAFLATGARQQSLRSARLATKTSSRDFQARPLSPSPSRKLAASVTLRNSRLTDPDSATNRRARPSGSRAQYEP